MHHEPTRAMTALHEPAAAAAHAAALAALDLDRGAFSYWTPAETRRFTRAAFWARVDGYMALIRRDARIGDFNLIVARTSADMMALFIALIASGRRASLFPPGSARQDAAYYAVQQREAIARIAPDAILLFADEDSSALRQVGGAVSDLLITIERVADAVDEAAAAARASAAFRAALDDPKRLLFWQHSSGTTGIKKAVGVTSAMLLSQYASYWPIVRGLCGGMDVSVASWLPLYHDMGLLTSFLLPLLGGSAVAIQDAIDWIDQPDLLLRMIAAERSGVCWMPNFAFRHFTRLRAVMPACDLSSVRAWISCSEPVRQADAAAFERAFAGHGVAAGAVRGCYAMAESVFAVSQLSGRRTALIVPQELTPGVRIARSCVVEDTDGAGNAVMSSGALVPDIEAGVFVDGEPVAAGVYGEIALRGPFVFSGYRGMSRAESNLRDDGFFLTGDLGAIIDGQVYVFGRSKEIIIVNGKNIYAGDVEDHINALPGVRPGRVVAFGVDNSRTGSEDLIVVAERNAASAVDPDALASEIAKAVSGAFLVSPADVQVVEDRWLVKSTSGKISRAANRERYTQEFGS